MCRAEKSVRGGIELETKAALTYNWNLIAGYAYTDTRFRQQAENTNHHPAMVPAHTASLWTDYTFDTTPLSGLTIGGGVRYNGKTQGGMMPTASLFPPIPWRI
ncbi:TonB-dependent receptor [Morganella morganii]|nr:TonB-dependent receptor [Morganella morganii]